MFGYRECSCFIAGPSLFDAVALYMQGQCRSMKLTVVEKFPSNGV